MIVGSATICLNLVMKMFRGSGICGVLTAVSNDSLKHGGIEREL